MTTIMLPGDPVQVASSSRAVTLGPGIGPSFPRSSGSALNQDVKEQERAQTPTFVATRLGVLGSGKGKEKSEMIWVEGSSKRYVPAQRELVLGTIIARHAEGYRVDIRTAIMASLDALAFEGATKRSKPNLKVGTLVYARVSIASRDMEPELECVDPKTGKSEGFGELKGGLVVAVSLETSRNLFAPGHPLLPALAAQIPFETAIGMNGRIWVKAPAVGQTIALKRVIEAYDRGEIGSDKAGIAKIVKQMLA